MVPKTEEEASSMELKTQGNWVFIRFSRATHSGPDIRTSQITSNSKRKGGKNGPMGQIDPYFDMESEPIDVGTSDEEIDKEENSTHEH